MAADTGCFADFDILYLGSHIRHIFRYGNLKIFQHIPAFFINLSGTPGFISGISSFIFQICIGNGCADRISIRVFMPDDPYAFFLFHSVPSLCCLLKNSKQMRRNSGNSRKIYCCQNQYCLKVSFYSIHTALAKFHRFCFLLQFFN